jgi:hypothetical protein
MAGMTPHGMVVSSEESGKGYIRMAYAKKLHRTDDEEERKRGHLLPLEWAWWLVSGAELEVGDCCRDF